MIDNDTFEDKYSVLLMKLAVAGHADLEDEFRELIARGSRYDRYGSDLFYLDDDVESFESLIAKLEEYDWVVTFKDFDCLSQMKTILIKSYITMPYCKTDGSVELPEHLKDAYERLARAGYFSTSQFNSKATVDALDMSVFANMSDAYYIAIASLCRDLYEADNPDYYYSVACTLNLISISRQASEPVLRFLASSDCFKLRRTAALSIGLPEDLLEKLADDDNVDVKTSLAVNNKWNSPSVVLKLANAHNNTVINYLSKNTARLTEAAMKVIAIDATRRNIDISEMVSKAKLSYEVMRILANAVNWKVRRALARKSIIPLDVRRKLATDKSVHVASAAKSMLGHAWESKLCKRRGTLLEDVDGVTSNMTKDPLEDYGSLFMNLAMNGRSEYEDELFEILKRSTNFEGGVIDSGDPMYYNHDEESFNELLEELNSYDWQISFKDFPTLTKMKLILLRADNWFDANEGSLTPLYEKLAKVGFFSIKRFDTEKKAKAVSNISGFVFGYMSDEYYSAIIDFLGNIATEKTQHYINPEQKSVIKKIIQAGASDAIIQKMLTSENFFVRGALALNGTLTDEMACALAADKKAYVKHMLIMNPHTPEPALLILASDYDSTITSALSKGLNLPISVVSALAESASKRGIDVKDLCYKENLPESVIRKLGNAVNWKVRKALAKRADLPADVLEKLSNDRSSEVKNAAIKQMNARRATESVDVYSIYRKIIAERNTLNIGALQDE
jgi:hypothetical protein